MMQSDANKVADFVNWCVENEIKELWVEVYYDPRVDNQCTTNNPKNVIGPTNAVDIDINIEKINNTLKI